MTDSVQPAPPALKPLPPLVRRLRVLGLIEGTSTLLLFLVAMPLKYGLGMDWVVRIVGSVHGALFIAYLLLGALAVARYRWPWMRWLVMFIGATLPGGPFIVDRWLPDWYRQGWADTRQSPIDPSAVH